MENQSKNIYPLDKHRQLLSMSEDDQGFIHKVFRLYAEDGDSVDIEVVEKFPPQITPIKTTGTKKIVYQNMDSEGYLNKVLMCEENGEIKEYLIKEKLPETKRKEPEEGSKGSDMTEETALDLPAKKSKAEIPHARLPTDLRFILLLLKIHVEQLKEVDATGGSHLFVALRTQSAKDVFRGLIEHQFLSCPVMDKDSQTYFGFIDMLDFVHYFIQEISPKREMYTQQTDLWKIMDQQSRFGEKQVKDLIGSPLGFRNVFHPVSVGYSLHSAVEILAKERHLHRVPVVDQNRRLVNILTQSMIIKFIAKNVELLGEKREIQLKEIPELFHKVYSIKDSDLAVDAFKLMCQINVTGVAVIGANGGLIGNISTKDLKTIDLDGKWWSRLFETAGKFLEIMNELYPKNRPKDAIYVLPTDTLETAIKKVEENRVHRLYIVNNAQDKIPIGVLSLREILEQIVHI